jgi:hypothetical protein
VELWDCRVKDRDWLGLSHLGVFTVGGPTQLVQEAYVISAVALLWNRATVPRRHSVTESQ